MQNFHVIFLNSISYSLMVDFGHFDICREDKVVLEFQDQVKCILQDSVV